ncbi:MAG: YsnF/AvaK domain-containing protein [Chloroflexota bacterium]|nr:YsnF/AvaK domain-containing protein [Chloroflexota bacterium]
MSNENQEGLLEDPNASAGSSSSTRGSTSQGATFGTSGTSGSTEYVEGAATGTGQSTTQSGANFTVTTRDDDVTTSSQTTDRSAVVEGDQGTRSDTQYVTSSTTQSTPASTTQSSQAADDDGVRVQLHEEELQAEKVQRQAGEVRVTKDVVEEQQTLEVPVTREQVHIESHAVTDQTAADPSQAFQEGTISVPVTEEEVQVQKQVRVAEELEIEKTAVQETERVADTVRREQLDVQEVGDVDVERRS